jgi:uncharacterized protein (TIGR03435 family)
VKLACLAALLGAAICAQAGRMEFEAATIKVAPLPDTTRGWSVGFSGGPGSRDPPLFTGQNVPLSMMVTEAYDIPFFLLDAAGWASDTRFNLTAKVPPGATRAQLREMLQNLLADRFHLKAHRGPKEMSVFAIVLARGGPKFKSGGQPVAPTESSGPKPMKYDEQGFPLLERPGFIGQGNKVRMWLASSTLDNLGLQICGELGRPVVNATGLDGEYDLRLYWVQDYNHTGVDPQLGPSLENALQAQLGLRLEARKRELQVLFLDSADRLPTDN